jgi:hypothetical protein
MSDAIYIDDGYTQTKTVPGVAGLYPELVVVFRPALARERKAYHQKGQSPDPGVLDTHETELIAKYVVSVNGGEVKDKDRTARLKPAVRGILVDLVLGYAPADEYAAGKI